MLKHLFHLFLAISGIIYANAQYSATPTLASSIQCASPTSINLNSAAGITNFPSAGEPYIGFTFQAKITSTCSVGSNKFYFLVVSFTNGGTDRRLIDFAYDPSVYRLPITMLSGTGSTVNGDPGNVINNAALPLNTWVEFAATLDFTYQFTATAGSSYKYAQTQKYSSSSYTNSLGFGSGWRFNSTTKFYLCSNTGSANPFSCVIQDFRIWWGSSAPAFGSPQNFISGTPTLFASYAMNDGDGTSLAALTGSLGSGYLGDSASSPTASTVPTWSSDTLEFTTTSQIVKFPSVTFVSANTLTPISFTMVFWVYLSSTPTATSTILQITSGSNVWLGVSVGTDLKLILTFNNQVILTESSALATSQWYGIAAGFAIKANMKDYIAFMRGTSPHVLSGQESSTISITAANNLITFGGFLGNIGFVRMFNPGGFLGAYQDTTGSYVSFGAYPDAYVLDCTSTSYYLYDETCVSSCPTKYYGVSTTGQPVCIDCPTLCAVCSSATSCSSCTAGAYFYNNECYASCPVAAPNDYNFQCYAADSCPAAARYGYNSQCITSCPAAASLIYDSQCFSSCPAAAPYAFNSQCITSCPTRTYVSGSNCQYCPASCSSCTSSTTCTSCQTGYSLIDSECIIPEKKTVIPTWAIAATCAGGFITLSGVVALLKYLQARRAARTVARIKPKRVSMFRMVSPQVLEASSPI